MTWTDRISSRGREPSLLPETSTSCMLLNNNQKRGLLLLLLALAILGLLVGVPLGIARSVTNNGGSDDLADDTDFNDGSIATRQPHQDFTLPPFQPFPNGPGAKYAQIAWKMSNSISLKWNRNTCDDFYHFACGRWIEQNPVGDYESVNAFQTVNEQLHIDIRSSLQAPTSPEESNAVRKAKDLYKSCMNTGAIISRRSQPLEAALKDVSALDTNENDIVNVLIKMAKYRTYPLGIFFVETDPMNTNRTVLMLDQPNLAARDLEKTGKYAIIWQGYRDWVNRVVYLLNEDKYGLGDQVVGDTDEMLNLMSEVTQLTTDPNDLPDVVSRYHEYTLGSLNTNFPGFDWKRYILGSLSEANVSVSLTDDEPVIVYEPNYFRRIGRYLSTAKSSAVFDYMRWTFTHQALPYLSHDYQYSLNSMLAVVGEEEKEVDRWKICEKITDELMPNVTGRLLVDADPDPEAIDLTREMIKDIKQVFETRMKGENWMDDQTTKKAIEKLEAMGELIGYPADIMNNTALDKQYDDFEVGTDYFENVMEGVKRIQVNNLRTFRKPTNREQWTIAPTTVNAFHEMERNIIVIPYGILRKPFFSSKYPRSVLYARLGTILAHEMTHGFDNKGRKFGKDGSVEDWWTPESLTNYVQKQHCFEKQYSAYSTFYPDSSQTIRVNGTRTLPENIADNGAIKDSFRAYTQWINRHGKEPELPYLSMTNNQVFYLAFAQGWCESTGVYVAETLFRRGTHSPGEFRVKGSLQNSYHFSETFKCASGSRMNPKHKCIMW